MDSSNSIHDDDIRSLFCENLPSLQEMASFRFALSLWSDVLSSGKYHDYKSKLSDALTKTAPIVVKQIKCLKIPRLFKNLIERSTFAMKIELDLWMIYHREHLLPGRRIILYTCHMKYCVWKSNGDINFRESARKMIFAKLFTDRVNFEIMCKFCMEDELKGFSIDDNFLEQVKSLTFRNCPLSYYWLCSLNKHLYRIPINVISLIAESSFESFMITSRDIDNWYCIEYFWNFLNEEEKIRKSVSLLTNPNTCQFMKQLFWKVNESQRYEIFAKIPVNIIMCFFRQYNEPQSACFIWMQTKHLLTGVQFSNLIDMVLQEMKFMGSLTNADVSVSLIKKMWYTAEDHQKNYIFEYRNDIVIDYFIDVDFVRKFDEDLQFLFDLFSFASVKYRKENFLYNGVDCIVTKNFSKINKLVELCLPNAKHVERFKKIVAESSIVESHCMASFTAGKFAYLDAFFKMYFPNDLSVEKYKKKMLKFSNDGCKVFIFNPNIWPEFEQFVDDIDSADVSYKTSTKKHIILSFRLDYFHDFQNIDQLSQMENVITRFLTEEEISKLKKSLLDDVLYNFSNFARYYIFSDEKSFNAKFFEDIITWCSDDVEKVSQFKQSIPFDKIFIKSMHSLMSFIRQDGSKDGVCVFGHLDDNGVQKLVALDEFLKWYLIGEEKIKKYKLDKIFDFGDNNLFENLVLTAESDEQDVKMLLIWFLGHDELQISKFKQECTYEVLSNVI